MATRKNKVLFAAAAVLGGALSTWATHIEKAPLGLTGWQMWAGGLTTFLLASALWAALARRSKSLAQRTVSAYIFQLLLLAWLLLLIYLFFHEGGHALSAMLFGQYDFARSDFWGLAGHPHSSVKAHASLAPWQQAFISGAGFCLPTLAGWVLFAIWISPIGRKACAGRPLAHLYASAIVAMLLLPFFAVAAQLLGVAQDGDWRSFVANAPRPLWPIEMLLWGAVLANTAILWRVVPAIIHAWKAWLASFQPAPRPPAAPSV